MPLLRSFTHPVQDFYLESYLPTLLAKNAYRPSGKPARKATQAQLDRMRSSFISCGVAESDVRALQALEVASRAEKIDFGLVGATVRSLPMSVHRCGMLTHDSATGCALLGNVGRHRWRHSRFLNRCSRNQAIHRSDSCSSPLPRPVIPAHPAAAREFDVAGTDKRLPPDACRQAQDCRGYQHRGDVDHHRRHHLRGRLRTRQGERFRPRDRHHEARRMLDKQSWLQAAARSRRSYSPRNLLQTLHAL